MKRKTIKWMPGAAVAAGLVLMLLLGGLIGWRLCLRQERAVPVSARISNYDQVIRDIRHGLRVHSSRITVRFAYEEDILEDLTAVVGDWVEQALAETADPTEGDYIRYQYGGYAISCSSEPRNGQFQYTVEIVPDYYMYLVQEEAVTERLAQVYASFDFDADTTDYEKIRTVYDYVCTHVRYDEVHRRHPYYHLKSTAYAALIQQTAGCQGYCTLVYRMLREWGVNCRIVTGTAYGENYEEFHAWNLVELEGQYYYLDATWDAGAAEYSCFLRGAQQFTDHVAGAEFEDVLARYPVAAQDYEPQ